MIQLASTETVTREPVHFLEKPGAAIACDMEGATDTAAERLAEYGRLFAHALSDRAREGGAVVLVFAAKAGVAEWVLDLARREHACCPFFSYHVSFNGDRITWRVSTAAGATAQMILDELYTLPEQIGDGLEGYMQRLAQRGVSVMPVGSKGFQLQEPPRGAGLLAKPKSACGC